MRTYKPECHCTRRISKQTTVESRGKLGQRVNWRGMLGLWTAGGIHHRSRSITQQVRCNSRNIAPNLTMQLTRISGYLSFWTARFFSDPGHLAFQQPTWNQLCECLLTNNRCTAQLSLIFRKPMTDFYKCRKCLKLKKTLANALAIPEGYANP